MLSKSILSLFIIVTFLTSCKQKEDAEANINSYANEVLIASQETTYGKIKNRLSSFKDKLNKTESMDSALVYKPKVDSSIAICTKMIDFLDMLIIRKQKFNEKDSLFDELKAFEVNVTKIDERVNQVFDKSILCIDTTKCFKNMDRDQFYNKFLKGESSKQTIIFLNSLKEDILIAEESLIHYFVMQCEIGFCGYYRYVPIIVQNSTYFKPNDELEITAGIGDFSSKTKPEFIINKKKLELEPDGAARYKMQVSNEKGKHIVPVKVSFIKPNGEKEFETKYVIYYVE